MSWQKKGPKNSPEQQNFGQIKVDLIIKQSAILYKI